jgi:hypothetical protein
MDTVIGVECFAGFDLGQRRDPSALAVVERADVVLDEMDYVTWERLRARYYRLRFLERIRLGTPYPDAVGRVREVVRRPEMAGRTTLTMDATGVGAPVLDMVRRADLGCGVTPVTVTGGERESHAGGMWNVPKKDLMAGLQLMIEKRELRLSRKVASAHLLGRELADMESRMNRAGHVVYGAWREGEHDDLVMALALACWRARWKNQEIWGTRRLL